MTYIDLINRFWKMNSIMPFGAVDTEVYMYLLHQCNIRRWQNTFPLRTINIECHLSISRKQLVEARNRLMKRGLISFVKGSKKNAPVYTILGLDANNVSDKTEQRTESGSHRSAHRSAYQGAYRRAYQEEIPEERTEIKPTLQSFETQPETESRLEYEAQSEAQSDAQSRTQSGSQPETQSETPNKNKTKTKDIFKEKPSKEGKKSALSVGKDCRISSYRRHIWPNERDVWRGE